MIDGSSWGIFSKHFLSPNCQLPSVSKDDSLDKESRRQITETDLGELDARK